MLNSTSNVYYDSLKFLNIMKTFLLATKNYDEKRKLCNTSLSMSHEA